MDQPHLFLMKTQIEALIERQICQVGVCLFKTFICIAFSALTIQTAHAKTIAVTSTADNGPGSLRQAIATASNGDKINIVVNGTITLTSGELLVNKSLTISGPGSHGSISGNNTSRVFHIIPGTTGTLDSLTITNGAASIELNNFPNNAGGGIYSDHANLTLKNCVVTNNVARFGAGIFSSSKDGGSANLTINNSTIINNSARDIFGYMGAYGGGIFIGGGFDPISLIFGPVRGESFGGSAVDFQVNFTAGQKYRITETAQPIDFAEESFNAIVAVIDPNGKTILDQDTLRYDYPGDYVFADETVTFVAPVTGQYTVRVHPGFSGGVPTFGHFKLQINTVSQGTAYSTLNLNNCTISGNSAESQGGGIFNDGFSANATLAITNSIISGNIANDGFNSYGYGGGIYNNGDSGNGLVTVTNSELSGNFANTWGGALFNNAIGTTPPLGSLIFGPVTGQSTAGSAVDYQVNFTGGQKYVITELAQPANPAENFDAIIAVIDPNGQTILDQDTLVDETVIFVAPVTGQYTVRVHPFYDNGLPTFGHFTLQINAAASWNANLTFNNCTISGNSAESQGAGIYSVLFGDGMTSLVTLAKCIVTSNHSDGDSGGIHFQGNVADGSAKLTMSSCTVTKNFAFFDAGGIEVKQAAAELTDSDISNNLASTDFFGTGGGIGIDNGLGSSGVSVVTMTNCTVTGNSATAGGGIETSGLELNLINCTIRDNSARFGGGIINGNGQDGDSTVRLKNSTVSGNSASGGGGGGILNSGLNIGLGGATATLELINSTVSGNSADFGGGILEESFGLGDIFGLGDTLIGTSTVIVRNSTISGNTADFGGGIFTWGSNAEFSVATLDMANSIINAGISGENLIAYEDGIVTSHGYNLSSDAAGGDSSKGPGGLLNGTGDIRNTDPMLGPLQNNGGPTMTQALLKNSPAINAGDPNFNPYLFNPPLLYDQRGPGFPRIVGGRIDIGSYEAGPH
jgi:hypothetical protein